MSPREKAFWDEYVKIGEFSQTFVVKHNTWAYNYPKLVKRLFSLKAKYPKIFKESEKQVEFYEIVSLFQNMKVNGGRYERQIIIDTISALKNQGLWDKLFKEANKYPDMLHPEDRDLYPYIQPF